MTTMALADQAVTEAPLRLTRRGRFVLIGLPLMLVAAGGLMLLGLWTSPVSAAGSSDAAAIQYESVTALEGDTLWSLALEFVPEADPRIVVDEIVELNDLPGNTVHVGQEIYLPVSE
ncbi:LysM peptidoglycan-binding domain-containing protein [Zhihengliuella sp.]|uniref:LysM peptidoglycan-binding domain-containing protein n=1 Tax=Zhihengliuella sp. TaxID=1954483 RepID=UPI002811B624|nr:LysM peptidoglycan-binding domain-containing protein [Zhihengliuella sp.]